MKTLVSGLLVIGILGMTNGLPATMEKMTMSRMRMADLETSASGYTYHHHPGGQASYVRYTNHGTGGYYDAPKPIQYINYGQNGGILHPPRILPSLPVLKEGLSQIPPGYVVPLIPPSSHAPLAPYYPSANSHLELGHIYDNDGDDDSSVESGEHLHDSQEEHGHDSESEEHEEHGQHDNDGYQTHHEFDNGEHGEHHADKQQGHYSEEGGNKKGHSESGGHYGEYEDAEKGEEGGSYGEESYHNKGEKTSGFHNVYHKDEYKKNTEFYDEDHKSGHYDKHSSSGEHHSSANGGYDKGGRHDSGYDNHEAGNAGHYDHGHENSLRRGSNSREGDDSYYNNYANHAARKDNQEHKKYGYTHGYK